MEAYSFIASESGGRRGVLEEGAKSRILLELREGVKGGAAICSPKGGGFKGGGVGTRLLCLPVGRN